MIFFIVRKLQMYSYRKCAADINEYEQCILMGEKYLYVRFERD